MAKRVQFVLTDDEYEQLKIIVAEKGVTISKYVKDKVIPKEDSFEIVWNEFLEKLEKYPSKIEFNVAQILTLERWNTLDKSAKLSIARLFNKNVTNGVYKNIVWTIFGKEIVRRLSLDKKTIEMIQQMSIVNQNTEEVSSSIKR